MSWNVGKSLEEDIQQYRYLHCDVLRGAMIPNTGYSTSDKTARQSGKAGEMDDNNVQYILDKICTYRNR